MTKKKHNILGEKLKDVLNQYCFQYKTKGGDAIDRLQGKQMKILSVMALQMKKLIQS